MSDPVGYLQEMDALGCRSCETQKSLTIKLKKAEQQAQEQRDQAAQYNQWTTDASAVQIAILKGILPISKAQLIHAAGLDADVAEKAELLDWPFTKLDQWGTTNLDVCAAKWRNKESFLDFCKAKKESGRG